MAGGAPAAGEFCIIGNMKKLLKIFLWTTAILATLAIAGGVALKMYFTPARVKRLALDYASSNLHREVDFKSAVLSLSGFSMGGLRVSEYPDFSKGEFLSAETISVRPALRELIFNRKIKINSVSTSGLKLKVLEVKKGVYNFSDLLAAKEPSSAAGGKKAAAAPPTMGIARLSVKNSQFSYKNAAGDLACAVKKINLDAKNISPDGLFPLEGDFTLDIAMPQFKASMPVYLKAKAALGNWDPQKGRAEIDKARISLGAVKLELSGRLADLLEPDAELKLAVKPFSSTDLKPFFPAMPARILLPAIDAETAFKLTFNNLRLSRLAFKAGPVSGALKGVMAWNPRFDYAFDADIKAQIPEMDSAVLAKKFKMIPAGFNIPLTEVKAAAAVKPSAIEVRSFSAAAQGFDLSGSA